MVSVLEGGVIGKKIDGRTGEEIESVRGNRKHLRIGRRVDCYL